MKEEIWNELYLYLIRIEIGVFKNFKECARSPCNGNHFSSIQESEAVIFNGLTPVFVASFVPELFTCLLGNSQREQTIV